MQKIVCLSGHHTQQAKTPLPLNNNGATSKSAHSDPGKRDPLINKLSKSHLHISPLHFLQRQTRLRPAKRSKCQRKLREPVTRCHSSQISIQDFDIRHYRNGQLS